MTYLLIEAQIIENNCRGYFSYLRGEVPITFPIRFYPDINRDINCIGGDYNKKCSVPKISSI